MGPRVSHIKYRNLYAGSAKCGQILMPESVNKTARSVLFSGES